MAISAPIERIGDRLCTQRGLRNLTYGPDRDALRLFDRQPQCLMHEASTPADVTHLKRGSEKLPLTKTVTSSDRSPRLSTFETHAATMAPSGTIPNLANRQTAINNLRAMATMAMRRVLPLSSPTRCRNHCAKLLSG